MHTQHRLSDRALLEITGDEATHFLDRLVTSAVPDPGAVTFSALLTPQGKILFDFFLVAKEGGYWVDVPADLVADFVKRLTFYKLRAAVEIADRSDAFCVVVTDGDEAVDAAVATFDDPRTPDLGQRAIVPVADAANLDDGRSTYTARRIALALPEGGVDFVYGDAFPHDVGLDQVSAVAFDKGCFVGQEVVSRMQHRGSARRRPVAVRAEEPLVAGADLSAGGPPIGTVTSVDGKMGVAIVRLDRAAKGVGEGNVLSAGETPVRLVRPSWASYEWPEALGRPSTDAAA